MAAPVPGVDQITVKAPKATFTLARVVRGDAVFLVRSQAVEQLGCDVKQLREAGGPEELGCTAEELTALKALGAVPGRAARAALVPARTALEKALAGAEDGDGHAAAATLAFARAMLGAPKPLPSVIEEDEEDEDEEEEEEPAFDEGAAGTLPTTSPALCPIWRQG